MSATQAWPNVAEVLCHLNKSLEVIRFLVMTFFFVSPCKSTPYAGGANSCFLNQLLTLEAQTVVSTSTPYAGGTSLRWKYNPTLVVLTPPTSPPNMAIKSWSTVLQTWSYLSHLWCYADNTRNQEYLLDKNICRNYWYSLQPVFFWDVLVICFILVWKSTITAFISLYFRTLWSNWLNFLSYKK